MAQFNGIFPNATFTRTSTAYISDGTSVANGSPRYVDGRFQNLVPAGPSKMDVSPSGWDVQPNTVGCWGTFTCTRSVDTTTKVEGTASQKYVVNGVSGNGGSRLETIASVNVKEGKQYTYSLSVKADRTMSSGIGNILYVYYWNSAGSMVGEVGMNFVELSTTWKRVSGTLTPPIGTIRVELCSFAYDPCTIWLDAVQFEEGTLTDWRLGGSGKGILIEEDTTNLLTANQSDVETDLTGLSVWQASGAPTLVRDMADKWRGTASAKATAAIAGTMTISTTPRTAITAGQSYTFSVYTKATASVGKQCAVVCYWFDSIGTYMNQSIASGGVNASSTWTRLVVSGTAPAGAATCYMEVQLVSAAVGEVLWLDGAQFEQKAYATSWILGGSTRNAETLTIPTTGLSPTQGTFEAWVYVNSTVRRTTAGNFPHVVYVGRAGGGNGIVVYHTPSGNWQLETDDSSGASSFGSTADTSTPDGWHYLAVKWSTVEAKLLIDGVVKVTLVNPKLPTTFVSTMNVGYSGLVNYSNTYFDEVRISTSYRTDADILANYNATKPFVPDQNTQALLHFDGNLLSHEEVKAVIMPNGNMHIRGVKTIG